MNTSRVDILGVEISAINMSMALDTIKKWVDDDAREYVCVTGVHGVMESQQDPDLRATHNSSGLTTPDGMPMVWAGRRAGAAWMDRVYGPDLMLEVCRLAAAHGWTSYFYGGAPGVPERLADNLQAQFPDLAVVGSFSPPFRPLTAAEEKDVADTINQAEPTLVWVGLSTPKQEKWMRKFRPMLNAPILFGVGAAFDIHAGVSRQAPFWMQRTGLEWLYRLWKEPKRLWRRYLKNNPRFVLAILRRRPKLLLRAEGETAR